MYLSGRAVREVWVYPRQIVIIVSRRRSVTSAKLRLNESSVPPRRTTFTASVQPLAKIRGDLGAIAANTVLGVFSISPNATQLACALPSYVPPVWRVSHAGLAFFGCRRRLPAFHPGVDDLRELRRVHHERL
jgi:hypothetical protein